MYVLWCRWRYAGDSPYDLYNRGTDKAPPHPERLESILDAFAVYAHEVAMKARAASL